MDAAEAASYVAHLDVGVAIPIHYDYAETEGARFASLADVPVRVLEPGESVRLDVLTGGAADARH
jgi:L-ascorbate metabolism protein UlaG (beta-lactamase superfamily)